MILDSEVEVIISNNGRYYASVGYPLLKQGNKLLVKIEHLPKNSNIFVRCSCDECGLEFKRQYQLLNKTNKLKYGHVCFNCSRLLVAKGMDRTNINKATKLRSGSKHPRWNPNKPDYQKYASQVRKFTEETYRKFKDVINPLDYPRTLCGIADGWQLDHRISILRGYRMGINPKVIGSQDNLQMLTWSENRQKHHQ